MGVKNTSDGSRNTAWDYVANGLSLGTTGPTKFLDCQDVFANASMQISFPSAPGSISINLEGSMDGINWTVLATSTSVVTNTIYSTGVNFRLLRANVTAASGGSSPTYTAVVAATVVAPGGSASGSSGAVTANQGTAANIGGAWPVKLVAAGSLVTSGTDSQNETALAVLTGTISDYITLNSVTTGTGVTVDLGAARRQISFQIVAAGTVTAGSVTMQVSQDGVTWSNPPTAAITNNSAATLANPYILVTNTTLLATVTSASVRYARAIVSATVTGGATVTVSVSAS